MMTAFRTIKKQGPTPLLWTAITTFLLFGACRQDQATSLDLQTASTKAGIGLIHFNTDHNILLYRSSTDSLAFDSLQFTIEKSGKKSGQCKFVTQHLKDKLQPYIMDPGDSKEDGQKHLQMGLIHFAPQLTFRVSEKMENGVSIVINEENSETCFVRLNPKNNYAHGKDENLIFFDPNFPDTEIDNWYLFETWPQAILRAFLIQVPDSTPTYDAPNGNLRSFKALGNALFNADSIYKDWVRIDNQTYLAEGDTVIKTWVRWIEYDSIKVFLTLNGGYE